jgi:hypothetical protein
VTLAGTLTVTRQIEQIFKNTTSRCTGGQGRKHTGCNQVMPGMGLMRGNNRNEYKRIRHPLARAQGTKKVKGATADTR